VKCLPASRTDVAPKEDERPFIRCHRPPNTKDIPCPVPPARPPATVVETADGTIMQVGIVHVGGAVIRDRVRTFPHTRSRADSGACKLGHRTFPDRGGTAMALHKLGKDPDSKVNNCPTVALVLADA